MGHRRKEPQSRKTKELLQKGSVFEQLMNIQKLWGFRGESTWMSANIKWKVGLNELFTVNSPALRNPKKPRQLVVQSTTLSGFQWPMTKNYKICGHRLTWREIGTKKQKRISVPSLAGRRSWPEWKGWSWQQNSKNWPWAELETWCMEGAGRLQGKIHIFETNYGTLVQQSWRNWCCFRCCIWC